MTLTNANATSTAQGKALVLGMGATGVSIANFLAGQGRSADFADSRTEPPGAAAIREALPGARTHCGELPASVPADVTELLISPGLGMQLPLLDDAAARGIPVRSDIDLFMSECPGKVLGITGSNGKSTVTTLVAEMLNMPSVSTIVDFRYDDQVVTVKRELEGGIKSLVKLNLPALFTCQLGLNTPRYPTLPNNMKAKRKEILSIGVDDLLRVTGVQETCDIFFPEKKGSGLVLEGEPADIADQLIQIIKDKTAVLA